MYLLNKEDKPSEQTYLYLDTSNGSRRRTDGGGGGDVLSPGISQEVGGCDLMDLHHAYYTP